MMSELEPTENELEQKNPFQEGLHRIYKTMQDYNIYAVRAWMNNFLFELAHSDPKIEAELENRLLEKIQKNSSGYLVFEGAHPDRETVIFKIKLENSQDSRITGHNEEYFYEDIVPEIERNMPEDLEHIKLPELFESGRTEEGSYIVTKFAEGEKVGRTQEAIDPLNLEEFDELIKFIKFFQEFLPPEKAQSLSPRLELNSKGPAASFEGYKEKFDKHKEMLTKMIGEDYTIKMEQQLLENEDLLKNSPIVFTNQDIIPGNLIRAEGDLYIIDWERMKVVSNAAAAYSHIIEAHWPWPEKQNEMIRTVLEQNKDIPNFKELLRLDMIYFKYSIGYWWDQQRTDNIPESQKKYETGSQALVTFLKDAIDKKGVWEDMEKEEGIE